MERLATSAVAAPGNPLPGMVFEWAARMPVPTFLFRAPFTCDRFHEKGGGTRPLG